MDGKEKCLYWSTGQTGLSEKVDARLILLSGQQTKLPISVENQFIHPTSTEWRNKNPLNTEMM
ncbi:hypothetical protein ACNR9V_17375 [Parageobacillus thermoglucosidasius]|uniref:hypothetical protein n=1 Tax=Parageobacillus thermoglucosidasius TaxID=1426 RepID=UPI003B67DD0C